MKTNVQRHSLHGVSEAADQVADEEPLQITVDGFPVAVVMRTPGQDLDLVHGFLLTEGFLTTLSHVSRVDLDHKENHALVFLAEGVEFDRARLSRNLFSASSCGICGKASIDSIRQQHEAIPAGFRISKEILLTFPDQLRAAQAAFEQTGGIHAAALFNAEGQLLVLREDVGRHNAIDKVIGWAGVREEDCSELVLQVSGRVSFEVMQKALAAAIPVVSAISAPSSLAVEFAQDSNQTLVGFLRPPNFNIYHGAERIEAR
jgi:FdhD protein